MEAADIKRRIFIVSLLSFTIAMGFSTWSSLFNNFSVEVLDLNSAEVGFIQSVREIPGLLGFMLIFLLMIIPESKIIGLMVALCGVGVFLTGYSDISLHLFDTVSSFTNFSSSALNLTLFTFIMSLGFHYYEVSQQSLILHSVDRESSPKVMGTIGSYSAAGSVIGLLSVMGFKSLGLEYKTIYSIIGSIVIIGGLVGLYSTRRESKSPTKQKLFLRRKFLRYYILTFLSGSRRQIFVVFAIYLMVKNHSIDIKTIATLMLVNQIISTYVRRKAGYIIAKYGEQLVMKIDYLLLAALFCGYAFIDNANIFITSLYLRWYTFQLFNHC